MLADPDFAPLFVAGSRAEVPIVGEVRTRDGGHYAVSGQIDRLAIVGNDVLILDYKTNRNPPREVPESYAVQMALYAHLLKRIFRAGRSAPRSCGRHAPGSPRCRQRCSQNAPRH